MIQKNRRRPKKKEGKEERNGKRRGKGKKTYERKKHKRKRREKDKDKERGEEGNIIHKKQEWPSGPRRQFKVLFSSEAWVRTPPLAFLVENT